MLKFKAAALIVKPHRLNDGYDEYTSGFEEHITSDQGSLNDVGPVKIVQQYPDNTEKIGILPWDL